MESSSPVQPALRPTVSHRWGRIVLGLALAVIGAAVLLASFKIGLQIPVMYGDKVHAAILWQGWHEHGWGFVREFRYPQDNWFLSLVLPDFLLFQIFGMRPEVLALAGWGLFAGNALLCGLIAWTLGARKSAFILPALLLLCGDNAFNNGLATHPFSHNCTNFYGLAVLWLCALWIKHRRISTLICAGLLSIAAGISDPWFLASCTVPTVLAAVTALALYRAREERARFGALILMTVLAGVSIQTAIFGLVRFLPARPFELGTLAGMLNNVHYLVACVAPLFFSSLGGSPFYIKAGFIVVAVALLAASIALVRSHGGERKPLFFVFLTALLSIAGIAAASILGDRWLNETSGRFFVNALYLIPLLVSVALELGWARAPRPYKALGAALGTLFLADALVSNWPTLSSPGLSFNTRPSDDAEAFFVKNGLTFGYGPYEGTFANALSAFSHSGIVIRPVNFSKETGLMHKGSGVSFSDLWYTEEGTPKGQREFFVVVGNDGIDQTDPAFYVSGLTRQFGPPSRTLSFNGMPVLVWDHPLFDTFQRMPLGTEIRFNNKAETLTTRGWSVPKPWGIETEAASASIKVAPETAASGDLDLSIEGKFYRGNPRRPAVLEVQVNGEPAGELRYDSDQIRTQKLRIPSSILSKNQGRLDIELKLHDTIQPKRGTRLKGLRLISLRLDLVAP